MQMMAKINAKLDIGWKLTTMSCPQCNSTTMAEPKIEINQIYCPKCDKKYPVQVEDPEVNQPNKLENTQAVEEEDNFYQEVYKNFKKNQEKGHSFTAKGQEKQEKNEFELVKTQEPSSPFKKTNDVSKKLGQKLMQGWTMLNESCHDCYSPLMQSKKGDKICCGCNRNFAKPATPAPQKLEKIQKAPKQEKEEKQKKVVKTQKQSTKPAHKKKANEEKLVKHSNENTQNFLRIENKALSFIQSKIDRAIQQNDLTQLQRLLTLVYKIKGEFKR